MASSAKAIDRVVSKYGGNSNGGVGLSGFSGNLGYDYARRLVK